MSNHPLSNREKEQFIQSILREAEVQVSVKQLNVMTKMLAERDKVRQAKNN